MKNLENTETITRTETYTVVVKQRKNGNFYSDLSKLELSIYYKSISKTKNQAKGEIFTSATIVSTWDSRVINGQNLYNSVNVIWNS